MLQPNLTDPSHIVFGGTFDPPHSGHGELVKLVHRRFPSSKVLIVPAFRPVVKVGVEKTLKTSFEHRVEMVKLAWQKEIKAGWVELLDIERNLPVPSYTLRTLQNLQAPERRLSLLLGLDQLRSFHQWFEPGGILRLAGLVVGERLDSSESLTATAVVDPEKTKAGLSKVVQEIGLCLKNLRINGRWNSEDNYYQLDGRANVIHFAGTVLSSVSSTLIRQTVENGKKPPAGSLQPAVLEYIAKHQLYQDAKGSN